MTDPVRINPFGENEDASLGEASLFRIDPLAPPIRARGLELYGPDTPGYRRVPVKQFWQEWFATDGMTLGDTYRYRVPVMWRIMRVMAGLRGLITSPRQKLSDVTSLSPSPWWEPFHFFGAVSNDQTVRAICQETQLPLLPPDIPESLLNGTVSTRYNPDNDKRLDSWIRLIDHICMRLGITRTRDGRYGIAGVTNPHTTRIAMPHPLEIMEFEERLIEKVRDVMLDESEREAKAWLRTTYDMSPEEVRSMMMMARRSARDDSGIDDPLDAIGMEAMRLGRIAERQLGKEDFRGAAQTIRDKARLLLQANTGSAPGDEDDFGSIVDAEVAREQKKALPPPVEDDTIETETPPD